ncbi:DUF6691 family protein [Novosphingobium aquimarinum]|uniref:DUF6691 family protein n=1 Tax=Novosphingobium aquimarinum TaxID=2682494 RepID=UPI0012EC62CB|nr:DUF6691 family protein [Novosphingobium aquimarinum]
MRAVLALVSGLVFGAGLAISGMMDPARVRGFLDVAGAWDPTLGFVMGGALLVMALAWFVQRRMVRPVADDAFALPGTHNLDVRLVGGAALFGIGWGLAGLCPGPAIASLAVHPEPAAIFVAAMVAGMGLFRFLEERR